MPRGRGANRMRLVKAPRLSKGATTLLEEASKIARHESDTKTPLVGFVLLAVFEDASMAKSCEEPRHSEHGIGRDIFWNLMSMALTNLQIVHIARGEAVDVHNETHGYPSDPDDEQ